MVDGSYRDFSVISRLLQNAPFSVEGLLQYACALDY